MVVLCTADYLWFVGQALDDMVEIVEKLGDDLANRPPDLEGANSPYVILNHCLGVMEYWGGEMVAGRAIERDRDAEFVSRGPVTELVERVAAARAKLERDMGNLDSQAALRGIPKARDAEIPYGTSQGGALIHIYEELSQHLGQMELTRDILMASGR